MKTVMKWLSKSIYRAIFLALLMVAVIPIIFLSWIFTRQSTESLTDQLEQNLSDLAVSSANEVNLRLEEVMHNTMVASQMATSALEKEMAAAEIEQRLTRYQLDGRNIWGLDVYYADQGGEEALGLDLSNVYWTSDLSPSSDVAREILLSEELDQVFQGIKSISPDTQWIYMTTEDGMMRLYPWASNDHYPDQWDPREIIFYTVADPQNNPELQPQWTPTYVDFAGAGWMVTASVPMVSSDGEFLGIMSHDVTIESLKEIANQIDIFDGSGYGFLIDTEGHVITHPEFQDVDADKGTLESGSLLTFGEEDHQTLIQRMVDGESGSGYYTDADGESLMVFAPIATTGWSLGISVPSETVIAPVMQMRNRAIYVTAIILVLVIAISALLSRLIHRPIVQLIEGVNQVTQDRRADEIRVDSFTELNHLATAFNEMATTVWEREEKLKKKVANMSIEIDSQRKRSQLDAIVETDFFKRLELNAQRLREDIKGFGLVKEA